jgi:hypothetical protein
MGLVTAAGGIIMNSTNMKLDGKKAEKGGTGNEATKPPATGNKGVPGGIGALPPGGMGHSMGPRVG